MKDTYGKLPALVVYNTNYFYPNSNKIIQIGFVLDKEFAVNEIIVILTLQQWKASIIFEGNFLTSYLLQKQFPIIYEYAKTGLPSIVAFDYNEFIQLR